MWCVMEEACSCYWLAWELVYHWVQRVKTKKRKNDMIFTVKFSVFYPIYLNPFSISSGARESSVFCQNLILNTQRQQCSSGVACWSWSSLSIHLCWETSGRTMTVVMVWDAERRRAIIFTDTIWFWGVGGECSAQLYLSVIADLGLHIQDHSSKTPLED